MKRLLSILFLCGICLLTWGHTQNLQSIPDSVYLRAYATTADAGRSGLRLEWSQDRQQWFPVAQGYGFLTCDFGPWGEGKCMYDPVLRKEKDHWVCTWKLNAQGEAYASARSRNLFDWGRQSYFTLSEAPVPQVLRIAYQEVQAAERFAESKLYRDALYDEKTVDDAMRFKDLKPLEVQIRLTGKQKTISDKLIGIFFEDISNAADGGLYAEMVRNRDFEFSGQDHKGWTALKAWTLKGPGSVGIHTEKPIHPNNPHYAVLQVQNTGVQFQNEGFDGFSLKKGEKYDLSFFAQASCKGKMKIRLLNPQGKCLAESSLTLPQGNTWKKLHLTLTALQNEEKAILSLEPQTAGTYQLDLISLFPQKTFKGHGLRTDLAETLAALHPKFVRFPGGCVAHGNGLDNSYNWKGSIGPLEARKPLSNIWNYHQTRGLGYHEYFQFCEDIGAEPLPVLAAGVPCQNSGKPSHYSHDLLTTQGQQQGIPLEEMDVYIQDILDLIEYANGDAKTTVWGRKRAGNGHPQPFHLKYLGIGNEDQITDVFEQRFRMIYQAVRTQHPEITVIGTVGPFYQGSDYTEGWKLADELNVPMVDEHYYNTPGWFIHNQDFYDKYDRSRSKVYLGEYAAHLPGRPNNVETALAEALYLTSVERNADVVSMTSYAPLLAKEGHTNWNPNLIYFNNQEVKPTVGYYVQQLFSLYGGNTYLENQVTVNSTQKGVAERIGFSAVQNQKGERILKMVNLLPVPVTVQLGDLAEGLIHQVLLTGTPDDKNARPKEQTLDSGSMKAITLPPYSFELLH